MKRHRVGARTCEVSGPWSRRERERERELLKRARALSAACLENTSPSCFPRHIGDTPRTLERDRERERERERDYSRACVWQRRRRSARESFDSTLDVAPSRLVGAKTSVVVSTTWTLAGNVRGSHAMLASPASFRSRCRPSSTSSTRPLPLTDSNSSGNSHASRSGSKSAGLIDPSRLDKSPRRSFWTLPFGLRAVEERHQLRHESAQQLAHLQRLPRAPHLQQQSSQVTGNSL